MQSILYRHISGAAKLARIDHTRSSSLLIVIRLHALNAALKLSSHQAGSVGIIHGFPELLIRLGSFSRRNRIFLLTHAPVVFKSDDRL